MMLTSQVFTILSKTAENEQVEQICKAADQYLYNEKAGGYRLNTDFGENRMNLGRMFGFAYGHKENGAVFCHMAVMYAYALYSRGFVNEGYRVLDTLKNQVWILNAVAYIRLFRNILRPMEEECIPI